MQIIAIEDGRILDDNLPPKQLKMVGGFKYLQFKTVCRNIKLLL